ncbi:uncharacterized protein A1O9_00080 [Exophiala aquamarina CBS 119918]|uniref:Carboxypeptidase M14B n=1 Tax=Exophiala aquamarina CBS 119918 TaxID=1182545 RepID=A0A072PRZ1_9EURO|nr:uncharacterized protein A1O9_00080 [Exophiala aquamarina CBS 119918]KEF62108.1 hypothetical protein A1O9_00080 [Exophiala aquamarina CBS 119918]
MRHETADFPSEEGRNIPYVVLSTSTSSQTLPRDPNKLRVWIQGSTHGDEPASEQSILAFLGSLDANHSRALSLLQKLDILILPRYNPDGVAYFQRRFATNFDPARDHIKLRSEQTRHTKSLFNAFAPHVAVDMHEFSAKARYAERYVRVLDGQFAVGKNLNIHPDIRRLSEDIFAHSIGAALEAVGLRCAPYSTGRRNATDDGRLSFSEAGGEGCIARNAWGLTQAVAILCETRGIGIADQHFARRTFTGLTMLDAVVSTAAQRADEVWSKVHLARQAFIDSREDIVVTDAPKIIKCSWPFVDLHGGRLVEVPSIVKSSTPLSPKLTRARPRAYLIPKAWSELIPRLLVNGIDVTTLEQAFRDEVEVLQITSVEFENEYHEGAVRAKVKTKLLRKVIQLPVGSFQVSTVQKMAALAFIALEPEGVDSFATMNIVPLVPGDDYPIFRVLWK